MSRSRRGRAVRALTPGAAAALALTLLVVTASPAAAVTARQVEEARQRLREVTTRLQGEVTRYESALLEESRLRERIDRLRLDLTGREQALAQARSAARERVAQMYIAAGAGGSTTVLSRSDHRGLARLAYLETVSMTDRELVNRLEQARRDFIRQQALLAETLALQEQLSGNLEELVAGIYGELDSADREYRAVKQAWDRQEAERIRREEEERRRREWLATSTTTTTAAAGGSATTSAPGGGTTVPASPPTTAPSLPPAPAGTMVCPVDGATTFRDSWGEPRSGGRSHTGVDMMSPLGTPVVAIENGVIYHPSWHYAGGIGLYIRGESGDSWYYAHLNGYAPGIQAGTRVAAGQLIGYVGRTGNAFSPHLHLARILPGGQYVNPYPVVASLC